MSRLGLVFLLVIAVAPLGCGMSDSPSAVAPPAATTPVTVPETLPETGRAKPLVTIEGSTLPQLVQIGDKYHAEVSLGRKGAIRVHTLAKDYAQIQEVEVQKLEAQLKLEGTTEPISMSLDPVPQPGDTPGKTSQFVGKIAPKLWGKPLVMTLPITINDQRYRVNFRLPHGGHDEDDMPFKVIDDDERKLYLMPGGKYTAEDINANGKLTASQKYDVSGWPHEVRPKSGEKLCPITLTKANPNCTWIVNGKVYEFCCPPCIDAFVELAKDQPDDIKEPEYYRKK